jgi:GNAT superfamily N-acetyltransferase
VKSFADLTFKDRCGASAVALVEQRAHRRAIDLEKFCIAAEICGWGRYAARGDGGKLRFMNDNLSIAEIALGTEMDAVFDLMVVLRPHLRAESFATQVRAQEAQGYRLAGGHVAGRLVVLAGYRLTENLVRGRHLFVDDLVTAPSEQGKGYGEAMLRYLAGRAKEAEMTRVWLDSRDTARTFYEQVGFTVHTSLPCYIDVATLT